MSNRLESLNAKKTSVTPTPNGLRFKPKVVARKSEQERAKDAPTQVKEENSKGSGASNRGRGSSRGRGRGGRNNYSGTHVVSAGPLASGSVSLGNASGTKLGLTRDKAYNSISSTPEFIQKLKLQDKTRSVSPDVDDESDEDHDLTKIDMTKQYRFSEEDSQLFPVRPDRDDPDYEKKDIPQRDSRESTASLEEISPVKREPSENSMIIDDQQASSTTEEITNITKIEEETESDKLNRDHKEILDLLAYKLDRLHTDSVTPEIDNVADDKFVLFQLPKILPTYQSTAPVKSESESQSNGGTSPSKSIQGQIGKLNIHKSGKITLNIGNDINLSVSNGAPTSFLQELVVLNLAEINEDEDVEMSNEDGIKVKGSLVRLGEVDGKIIATPSLE